MRLFSYTVFYIQILNMFTGLVVDNFSQRLFWADFELSVIGSIRFDGSDSVICVSSKQGKYIFVYMFEGSAQYFSCS